MSDSLNEIDGMGAAYEGLKDLNPEQRRRAIAWVNSRLDWEWDQREGAESAAEVWRQAIEQS